MPDHTDNLHNKIVQKLAVEGKEHLLPPDMLPFLASLDSSSSDYNEGYLQALTQGCEIALERWGRQFARQFSLNLPDVEINLKKEMVAQLYTDFSRGIMYAAKHFDRLSEGSEIHQIRKIVITDAPESRVDAFGFASEDGKTVGMFRS